MGGADISEAQKIAVYYRHFDLPANFPVIAMLGDRWVSRPEPIRWIHFHNCLEFGFLYEGSGLFYIDGETLPVEGPCVTVIPQNVRHLVRSAEGSLCHWNWLFVDPAQLMPDMSPRISAALNHLFRTLSAAECVFPAGEYPQVYELLGMILREMGSDLPFRQEMVRELLSSLFLLLLRRGGSEVTSRPVRQGMTSMLNSLFVAGTITVGQVLTSATAGYAFAKIDFRGRDKVFLGYLATMMVPFQVVMIPQFILFRKLGLTNTHWALILPGMFTVFGVFMLRQFFQGIPDEMIEAARLDGCSEFGILMRMVLPLSKAALSSLAIFTFRWQWNDYLAPLIYLNDKPKFTLTIALAQFKMENITLYTLIMAGSVITLIPVVVLFMFTQKYLIQGITMTGMKG